MGLFNNSGGDKDLARLMTDGELAPATIYAIRVQSDGREWSYGLDVQTASGPRRLSVRQVLAEEPQLATLGAAVVTHYLDGQVVIDWSATLAGMGVEREVAMGDFKSLKQPLEAGIQDDRIDTKQLNKWKSGVAKIVSFERSSEHWNLEVELDARHDATHAQLTDQLVPSYAEHLLALGTELPVSVDPADFGRVAIDWPAAAENSTGDARRAPQA
jgi:hypothetical protein